VLVVGANRTVSNPRRVPDSAAGSDFRPAILLRVMAASADRRLTAGRYVLGAPLGQGGMGTVWRADDVLLGRPVAVKEVTLPDGLPGAERAALRDRALREARAAARLNHPSVVTLHDVLEADGRLFLVMELVEAPTLRERVAEGGLLAPAAAARIGLELLDALEAAHRAGIVHHDVKPANVMVPARGRAKLADFGIASLQEDTQRTLTGLAGGSGQGADRTLTAAFGSLPYVAPEQASGRRVGPAADLWGLGATLWFAVEGTPPFERAGPAATLGAILHDPPGRPARAGPLGPVLLALLAKDPERRPAAQALRGPLERVAGGASDPTLPLGGTAGLTADPADPNQVLAGPAPPPGHLRPAWGQPRSTPTRRRRRAPTAANPPPGWGLPPPSGGLAGAPPRPRRRRRRLLLAAGLLVLLLAAGALSDADRRSAGGPAGLDDPVRDGQFEFVVGSVRCGVGHVGEGIGRREPLEQFCLAEIEVENTGREGRTFAAGWQYLFDEAGNRHDVSGEATALGGSQQLLSTHLNPGQRIAGTLVYDVPDPIRLARVELHDAPFSGGAGVDLG
jgi:eukaryotic-like serine/threonine-protein kinase